MSFILSFRRPNIQQAGGQDIILERGSANWNYFRPKKEIKPGVPFPGQVKKLAGLGARGNALESLPLNGSTYGSRPRAMAVVSPCLCGPQNKPLTVLCVKTCIL